MAPIPIIFDTDIGNDVDDTWAIAMALNCPELELRYVMTAGPGCHDDRAKLVAKLLDAAGVAGVPIGKGCDNEAAKAGNQAFEGEPGTSPRALGWRITISPLTLARCTRTVSAS